MIYWCAFVSSAAGLILLQSGSWFSRNVVVRELYLDQSVVTYRLAYSRAHHVAFVIAGGLLISTGAVLLLAAQQKRQQRSVFGLLWFLSFMTIGVVGWIPVAPSASQPAVLPNNLSIFMMYGSFFGSTSGTLVEIGFFIVLAGAHASAAAVVALLASSGWKLMRRSRAVQKR
jgi:hypothetical protein